MVLSRSHLEAPMRFCARPCVRRPQRVIKLALQLPFCSEVSALSDGLVSPSPERPCDDVLGLNVLSREPDGDATDFLD